MEKSSELRRRAQKKLGQRLTPEMSALSTQDVANLIQELQLYQAEVKLQNEELRQAQQQLGASHQRYIELYDLLRTLIDHLPTYVYIKDIESRFLLGNSAVVQVMNAPSAEALLGKTDFDFYPEPLAAQYYADEQRIMRSGQPIINKKEPLIDPAGRKRWLSTTKVPLHDGDGKIIGLVGIGQDITVRSYADQRIKLLQSITQNISEATDFQTALTRTLNRIGQVTNWDYGEAWTLDETENVMKCSPAWYSSGKNLKQFRAQSERLTFPFNVGLPGRCWASAQPEWIRDMSSVSESHFARRQLALDSGLKAALAVPFLANERIVVILVFFMVEAGSENDEIVDIISTVAAQLGLVLHRKKVEDEKEQLLTAVSRQREELRALAGRLAEIQESERQQLARELHDQVGQNLTALGFNLEAIGARLVASSTGGEGIQAQLDDSLALVQQTTDRIRDLMAELRPPMLDEYGMGDALDWYAERFTARTGLLVNIENRMFSPRLSASIETALLRICQEALTNVAKHAQAKAVTLTIIEENETVRLIVADDGSGFDQVGVTGRKQSQNLGLLTIRERALAVGGRCRIESQPGQGTQVIVEVPR